MSVSLEKKCCQFYPDSPVMRIVIGRFDDGLLKGGKILHGDTVCREHAKILRDYLDGDWFASRADFQRGLKTGFEGC